MQIHRRRFLQSSAALLAAPALINPARAADPIKIAGIFDQSGGLDIYGQPMVACLELAVDDLNGAGGLLGRKVELIKYDPQSNIQFYTQFATAAATKDKAAAVFAGITSASREAIRPVLRRYQTVYFYPTLYEGGVCDRNTFITGSTPGQTIDKILPAVMKEHGKKIYVIAADYNFGQISSDWVKKYAKDNGGEVVATDFFPLDVTEFGPTIKKIQAAKPDILFTILVGGNHMSFFRQWAAAGMAGQIPIASSDFGTGNEHKVLTPAESNGIVAAYGYFQELQTPGNAAFLERLRHKFGDKTPYLNELAVKTWYAVMHWANGVKTAGSIDRMAVIKGVETNPIVDGPGGRSTMEAATHHCRMDVHLASLKDGAFVVSQSFPQQPPSDTAAVCDLLKNPDEDKQFVIKAGT
jgi:urea transport system substrate-binding protein